MFQKKVEQTIDCDVLVVGGGVAGFGAAMGASKTGVKVVLTESNGYLGGCATAGLVAPFMTCYDALGETQIIRGVFAELVERLVKENGAISPADCRKNDSYSGYKLRGHLGTTPFDKEKLKYVMESICIQSGVRLLYHFFFIGVEKSSDNDREITACIFATKNGLYRIRAKSFIDCTGDAAVCHEADGAYVFSDEDGALQPVTTFFLIDGVDKVRLDKEILDSQNERKRGFMEEVAQARAAGEFPCGTQKVRLYEQLNGVWSVNMCQIDEPFDVNDPLLISNAEIEGRKQVRQIFHFLKKYVVGLENIRLLQTSESVGIRESRRIVGEYTLTYEDIATSQSFEDTVVVCANAVDVHTSGTSLYKPVTNSRPYAIPYRILVHRDFDNLWTAGKTVSADRLALGAIRVMPPAMAMGQAAGIASALAITHSKVAKEVPYEELRRQILEQNGYLGE